MIINISEIKHLCMEVLEKQREDAETVIDEYLFDEHWAPGLTKKEDTKKV